MKLKKKDRCHDFVTTDAFGVSVDLLSYRGKAVVLSFFSENINPFNDQRFFELSRHQKRWRESGIEVITVFSLQAEEIKQISSKYTQRLTMIADPEQKLYARYGVNSEGATRFSLYQLGMLKLIPGLSSLIAQKGDKAGVSSADFLIDPNGEISDLWYGVDTHDHIPIQKLERFAVSMNYLMREAENYEYAA